MYGMRGRSLSIRSSVQIIPSRSSASGRRPSAERHQPVITAQEKVRATGAPRSFGESASIFAAGGDDNDAAQRAIRHLDWLALSQAAQSVPRSPLDVAEDIPNPNTATSRLGAFQDRWSVSGSGSSGDEIRPKARRRRLQRDRRPVGGTASGARHDRLVRRGVRTTSAKSRPDSSRAMRSHVKSGTEPPRPSSTLLIVDCETPTSAATSRCVRPAANRARRIRAPSRAASADRMATL